MPHPSSSDPTPPSVSPWVGTDTSGGIPVPAVRPDTPRARHWSLEAVAATERPRHPDVWTGDDPDGPAGARVAFVLDRDTSDIWVLDPHLRRLTVDRPLTAYWEDAGPRWSPDGTRLAYTAHGSVWLTDGGPSRRLTEASSPVWIDDSTLVVEVEHDDRTILALVEAGPEAEAEPGAGPAGAGRADLPDATPWVRPLPAPPGDLSQVAVAPDRRHLACVRNPRDDLNASRILVVDLADHQVRELPGPPRIQDRDPAWSPDGSTVVFASEETGWFELWCWDQATGARRPLTAEGADFSEPTWGPAGLAAIRSRHGVADLVLIDPAASPGAEGQVTVVAAGGTFASPHWCGSDLIASHESATMAPRLVRVGSDGDVHELLAPTPAPVRTARHVAPEHLWYPAPGGDVPAFCFRPPGAGPDHRVPVVVNPHGGPTSLYGDEWDGIAQYFVDRGYGWLAPNFKGSTSYGRGHERANHGVWGVADTADCLAAHDWLATQDWVDPRRIAIFGASYGSYLALLSVVDGDRFACAVAKYGDCDIVTSWAQGDRVGRLDLERMMGRPAEHPEAYRAGSPIHRIERLSAPVLVAHGLRDERVHPAQSEELVAALDRIGATYSYVTYPTEGHGFLHREPFLDFYRRLERFLDWYLM